MRRIDLINSVNKIGDAIKKSGLHDVFLLPPQEKQNIEVLLKVFQQFAIYEKAFGENEKKVLDIFQLSEIGDPKLWARILVSGDSEKGIVRRARQGLHYFLEFLPELLDLLKQDNILYYETESDGVIETTPVKDKQLLTVILPEYENQTSHPDRLIKALESISLLYNSFSIILGESNSDLSVVAIDSGSDKSFDFLGAAKLMESIKEMIIGLWDRIVFFREKQLNERLDLIAKSLPILEKISEMQQSGALSPEQTEILKRNITTATNNFISAGAVIPELDDNSTHSPRKLMATEPKLLINSTSTETKTTISNSDSGDNISPEKGIEKDGDLSDEEIAALKKLFNKNKKAE